WVLAALAAAGFPGLAGFVGQLLVVLGAYPGHRLATPLALLGVLVVAGVLIWTSQRIFFGPAAEQYGRVRDVGTLELANGVGLLGAAALTLQASRADVLPGESPAAAVPGFFLLAPLGALLAASAAEMVSVFLSLELLAVNLYVLAALTRRGAGAISASLGYL